MFKLWAPKGSVASKTGPRRQRRKTASRFPLKLERCEDRLAAGQLFSFLSSPLGDLAAPSLDMFPRESESLSAPTSLSVTRVLSDQIGFSTALSENESAREHDEPWSVNRAAWEPSNPLAQDGEEADWATAHFTESELLQPPFTTLHAPFARSGVERTRMSFPTREGSPELAGAAMQSASVTSGATGNFDLATTPQVASVTGATRREAATLALLAGDAVTAAPTTTMVVRGTLEVLCAVDEEGRHQQTEYYLDTGETRLRLQAEDTLAEYQSGTVMTVRGVLRPDGLAVAPGGIVVHQTPETNDESTGAGRAVRWILVINVNFSDRVQQPWTVATARNLFTNNIANWFSQGSYGQTTTVTDVVGWYTIAATSTSCATSTWSSQAQARARSGGWEPNNYNHVVIAFPRVPACSWGGLGQVPGRITWLNNAMNLNVAVHELGHNLGLAHSKSQRCSTGPLSGTCTTTEYGDRYDIMGGGGPAHFHASYRAHVGWIPSGSRRTLTSATREAVVGLRPAESSTGTRLLRVQRRGRSDYLHVEVRSATGFDSVLNQYSNLMNGVAIYLGTSLRDQKVIDFTYTTSSAGDAAVRFNNILWDWVGDVLILPMYRTNGVTYVYVQYGING